MQLIYLQKLIIIAVNYRYRIPFIPCHNNSMLSFCVVCIANCGCFFLYVWSYFLPLGPIIFVLYSALYLVGASVCI